MEDSQLSPPGTIALLSTFTPPSLARAWLTAPHPSLPIVATCSSDKSVRIYSLTSFTLLSTISGGHKRSVRTCAWKPGIKGESVLATGSFDASVGVWKRWDTEDMNPRPERDELDFTNGMDEGGENDNTEEDEEWRFALVLDGHDSEVKSVSWSTGGNFLATCSRDKSVWIWEEVGEDDFETIAVLQEHQGDVKCVAWHPEEELLASASYDDDIRLWKEDIDDWGCVSVLRGHDGTVWAVDWEGLGMPTLSSEVVERTEAQDKWIQRREASGPRLVSCSHDMTIRVWRRLPREKGPQQSKLSIIRTGSNEETWIEEAQLPQRHERPIYSVSWSKKTRRIVSTGGDGKIVIYAERWKPESIQHQSTSEANGHLNGEENVFPSSVGSTLFASPFSTKADGQINSVQEATTEWYVVAELEDAHDVFEVNHVCWARRADRNKRSNEEEVIISTGDDGAAKVWTVDV
ncbi:MAG: Cytosolic iron-sulfur protein assembly protein [Icmadophila ericetorum]|nr:Cytosolic iron-sulfur protein assembly protein [Icmadophila ericetorum]